MKLGTTIPNIELGPDPRGVVALCQAAEDLGYQHLMSYDHVIGADLTHRQDWKPLNGNPPPYTINDAFHEPLMLYCYIAAFTKKIEFATGIIIMPQRQTVLLAKQVAELDILCDGRVRLGVGIGWNDVEYEALNMSFQDRGARSAEQIVLLRKLWTERCFSFEGKWHSLRDVGINPLPVQQPIPIWLGGEADPVLKRVAELADGWYPPSYYKEDQLAGMIERLYNFARDAGRDPATIGINGIIRMHGRAPEECVESMEMWKRLGATHVTFNTESDSYVNRLPGGIVETRAGRADLTTMDERIDAIRRFREAAKDYLD